MSEGNVIFGWFLDDRWLNQIKALYQKKQKHPALDYEETYYSLYCGDGELNEAWVEQPYCGYDPEPVFLGLEVMKFSAIGALDLKDLPRDLSEAQREAFDEIVSQTPDGIIEALRERYGEPEMRIIWSTS